MRNFRHSESSGAPIVATLQTGSTVSTHGQPNTQHGHTMRNLYSRQRIPYLISFAKGWMFLAGQQSHGRFVRN